MHKTYTSWGHSVFVSAKVIRPGEQWVQSIDDNIAMCNLFLVLITPDSLRSSYVAREVLHAQKLGKQIIPCRYSKVDRTKLKWDLNKIQEVEFYTENSLVRELSELIQDIRQEVIGISKKGFEMEGLDAESKVNLEDTPLSGAIIEERSKEVEKHTVSSPISAPLGAEKETLHTREKSEKKREKRYDWRKPTNLVPILGGAAVGGVIVVLLVSGMLHQGNQSLTPRLVPSFTGKPPPGSEQYSFLRQWGSPGSSSGQLLNPHGIAIDAFGVVYVADTGNNRIQKFDSNGKFITKWGSPGAGNSDFGHPFGIAVDSSGNVYVADTGNSRIQVFSSTTGVRMTGSGNNHTLPTNKGFLNAQDITHH